MFIVMNVEDTLIRKTPFLIAKAVISDGEEGVWMQDLVLQVSNIIMRPFFNRTIKDSGTQEKYLIEPSP
jgi:hypothetical protein